MVLAETEAEALAIARPAWEEYVWNLETPRRLEAERRGLTQFLGAEVPRRPAGRPSREADPARYRLAERTAAQQQRRTNPGGIGGEGIRAGFSVMAGTPDSIRAYMDEYVTTGANYFVCAFQWGQLRHEQAMRSIELFVTDVMPHYLAAAPRSL
jgi:alkanesulfonate monooxygenase SsuD/methylene tetrahydromethanopterin reductase-like flavin-dependent oxidoreductase (luciferase family)